MRIVGGKYRGRVLSAFKGDRIRPTSDKVRESLFNILAFRVPGCKFLDLFSGTGAMGIEALSRNADFVVFNDFSKESIELIKKNLTLTKDENYKISISTAESFINCTREKFDIIYIDPPYKSDFGINAIKIVDKILSDDGIVVFEDEKPFQEENINSEIIKYDERKYGRVYLTFFKRKQ